MSSFGNLGEWSKNLERFNLNSVTTIDMLRIVWHLVCIMILMIAKIHLRMGQIYLKPLKNIFKAQTYFIVQKKKKKKLKKKTSKKINFFVLSTLLTVPT
jgi:hypothetical protein